VVVVMKPGATAEQIKHIAERVEEFGLRTQIIYGTERTVIAAIGDKRGIPLDLLKVAPGVERVVPILAPYKMASREARPEQTTVQVGAFPMGSNRVGVIAGPCSVEGRDQTLDIAKRVRDAGAVALRGGAFKPRTSPYSFQGLEFEGLEYLARAREATGLAIVTEVTSSELVEPISKYADVLQIGARNMQNFLLLKAVGASEKPVLLKRGFSSTLDEFLFAAEYVLAQGNPNVILCERGIRTFEDHTRFTLSLSIVPALKERTHLPVIVDPSHATGVASLVPAMCRSAVAAGADGLIVEVHPDPERAVSDGAQSLTCEQFEEMMRSLRKVAEAVGREL